MEGWHEPIKHPFRLVGVAPVCVAIHQSVCALVATNPNSRFLCRLAILQRCRKTLQIDWYSITRLIETTRIRWGYGDISLGDPLPKPARGVRRDSLAVVVISCNARI
ncbi:hypothetical protein LY76DRAFT_121583 [Colletotrichum caudatum]|nr:hypothetical protein LY76DRAFT_121583 [Colletotrichum caudatum]